MRQTLLALLALLALTAATPWNAFDAAADALARGLRAEARADRPALRAAVRALEESGAAPVAGQVDAAAHWAQGSGARTGPATRDRALGPGYRQLTLSPGAATAFEATFLAGQRARVAVVPAPSSAIALRVSEVGQPAICDAAPARPVCDWVPGYTARFQIEVRNPGSRATRLFILVQ
jgi:hypothetical protein